jgi:3-oxoacyl-(acyl-carrier-protein) synthase III
MSSAIRSKIVGTGSYTAAGVLTNFDLEKLVDTSNDWIVERTGIRERRVAADDVNTSDMATHSLKQALDMAGLAPSELDMIICGTVTPDRPLPANAAYVQQKIGANNHCASFDLAAACAGFLYGMSIADAFIRVGQAKTVGVIGVELLSRILDYSDRNTCVLFGDGAGAAVLTADDTSSGVLSTHIYTDGNLTDLLLIPAGGSAMPTSEATVADRLHYVRMEGREGQDPARQVCAQHRKIWKHLQRIDPDRPRRGGACRPREAGRQDADDRAGGWHLLGLGAPGVVRKRCWRSSFPGREHKKWAWGASSTKAPPPPARCSRRPTRHSARA